ncbi:MAG: VOC family protein [Hamadaea sp.]|uniref:VOC family protein n=1 Tax=Hamadaea sp. TaxID=2024425 RepID=UPI0017BF83E5|nr:VOC family protein [Hamadaea sp.]NUR74468.1 VOC family protein [Hamadaea sp.]NUT24065.1 VOC family protein [Hamadaea sp.]
MTQKITPMLWFDNDAEEAAEFYVGLFPDSRILEVSRYGEGMPKPAGTAMVVNFEIAGQRYQALNGGPEFKFTEAVSFVVDCADQKEVDYYWYAMTADGGEESQCGWLKDKFGVSWQIIPQQFASLVNGPDPAGAQRATQAMFGMQKLDVQALQDAYDGKS